MRVKSCLVLFATVLLTLGVWVVPGFAQIISVNNEAKYATSRNVTLTLSDEGQGATQMQFCDESTPNLWTAPEPYATTKNWTLTSGDGEKTVWVRFLFSGGGHSDEGDSIFLDTNAPTGTIVINNGDQYTNSNQVTLTLAATDNSGSVTQMRFSNDGSNWSNWEIYRTIRYSWGLLDGDGSKTVFAQFRDEAGHISSTVSDNIILDLTAPAGCSVRINGGAGATAIRDVTLTLAATGADEMRFSNDNSTWTDWEGYSPTRAWTLALGSAGVRTVYVQFRDQAGNSASTHSSIILDLAGPTGSFTINGGAAKTASRNVTLNLAISGASQMRFSNTGNFTGVPWEDYNSTWNWTLTAGESLKTVFAEFQDEVGHTYPVSDAIYLDPNAPLGTVAINGGSLYTNDIAVTLNLTTSDASQMRFSHDGSGWSSWVDYAANAPWNLTTGDGLKTVYVQFKDDLGNVSGSFTDTITLDRTAPSGSMIINNDAEATNNRQVNLTLSAMDAGSGLDKMAFSDDGANFSAPEPFVATKTWNLTAGDGQKWVSVKCLDKAGNYVIFSDAIMLDTTPPTGFVTINGGAVATNTTSVTLTTDSLDAAQMRFSNNNVDWSAWETFPAIKPWTLASGDGLKTVYAQFRDAVGNVSAAVSDTITLNTAAFSGNMTINNGAAYTNSLTVTLNLNAPGATQMRFSANNINWPSYWVAYATTSTYALGSGQGLKTVYAQFKNAAGTVSDTVSATITLDSVAPTGAIVINNDAAGTNNRLVTLTLTATDTASGLNTMAFSNDSFSYSAPEPFTPTKTWNLTAGDDTKFVYVRYTDKAGNEADYYDYINLDTTAPTGTVSIIQGAYTTSTSVRLLLNSLNAFQMRFSNDNSVWSNWESYNQIKDWTLAGGDGLKTVYVQFRDNVDNSSTSTATITLDTTGPSGAILINGGANLTNLRSVTLTLTASDADSGVDQMAFSNDGSSFSAPEPFAATKTWDLSEAEGVSQVYVRFYDKAGNVSAAASDTITLDYSAPTGTVVINGAAQNTNLTGVTLTVSANGASQMRFSNGNSIWSAWETYATSKSWLLSDGDGVKWVYAQFQDEAGNISDTVADSIVLDTASSSGTVSINGGAAYTRTNSVTLSISSSGPSQINCSNDGSSWSAWEDLVAVKSWTLSAGDGVKTVFTQFKDGADNISAPASDQIICDATPPTDGVLVAAPGANAVTLNWSGFADVTSGLKTYRLYYGASGLPPASGAALYEGSALTFNHSSLDLKQSHYYRLVAEDQAGNVSPGATAQAGATQPKVLVFLFLLLE